jgi:organic radical activating enzyme
MIDAKQEWIDGVVITGGEPTLHQDLPQFIRQIKSKGLLVKLDTNGSNPEMLKKLDDKSYVKYSPYGGTTLTNRGLKIAEKITRKHRLLERFLHDILRIPEGKKLIVDRWADRIISKI